MDKERIGFGRRLGAILIDTLIVGGLGYIIASVLGDSLEAFVDFSKINSEQLSLLEGNEAMWFFSILMPIASGFAGFIYFLLEGVTGYSLGKLILGIQIGTANGEKATIGVLMARFALKNISTIFTLLGAATLMSIFGKMGQAFGFVLFIGCFFAIGEKKQALHDLILKTAVYNKKDLS